MTDARDKFFGIAGLALSGVAAFAFLAIAGRALGAAAFVSLGALWAVVFLMTAALVPITVENTSSPAGVDHSAKPDIASRKIAEPTWVVRAS